MSQSLYTDPGDKFRKPLNQIEKDNLLIARFMNWEQFSDWYGAFYCDIFKTPFGKLIEMGDPPNPYFADWELEFHFNWNWLMLVVEEISNTKNCYSYRTEVEKRIMKPFSFKIDSFGCEIQDERGKYESIVKVSVNEYNCNIIESVRLACVKFICWYKSHEQYEQSG